jgi:hypothetical protein
VIGIPQMTVSGSATATMASKIWQVCVLITEPFEKHTLKVEAAKIDFDNCMVQVNTANWDAVESRDGGYIHSKNGENCFVGDIHYGDVQPPKNPSCTMLPDPYASYQAPSVDCNALGVIKSMVVNLAGTVLSPGTYCGGIVINKKTTFNKGLYIIKDGPFQIAGSGTNVTADGATFLLVGSLATIDFNTTGHIKMSPANEADAGKFAGFQFFHDWPEFDPNGKKKGNQKIGVSNISSAKVDASGIFYLAGQQFTFGNRADVTIKPGVIIAEYILPDSGAHLKLTGTMPTSSVALELMTKTGSSGPRLIK